MKIYLCDYTFSAGQTPKSLWCRALSTSFGDAFQQDDKLSNSAAAPLDHPAYQEENSILIVHTQQSPTWWDKINADACKCNIVFVRSKDKQSEVKTDKTNIHGCYWTAAEFESQQHEEIKTFIRQVKEATAVSEIGWDLLKAPPETALALRLLCEAWKQVHVLRNIPDGITIHAPDGIEDWLAPFELSGPNSAKKIQMLASKFGSEESWTKAKSVLNAVDEQADPGTAVEEFLKHCLTSSTGSTES